MVHDPEKQAKARDFRKRGFTYSEIAKIVGVSRSTLSNWFSKETFSRKVKKDNEIRARRDNVKRVSLLNKARKNERSKQYQKAILSAKLEFKHFKSTPLFIAGLATYKAVGDVSHPTQIRVPSQRISVHKLLSKFMCEFLGAEKSRIYSTTSVTILNDALAKKKLITWIDLLP